MKKQIKPDFFIVGAPKCGTTSLYHYLRQHPQVYLPRIKELNYFCTDLHFRFPLLNENQFLSYYADYGNEKAAGEVSVWNLYSKVAAQQIMTFNPDSRIIILLRNPADMLYALHSNHVFNDNELIQNFEEALAAADSRKKGLLISPVIKCPVEALYYYDVAAYGSQVKRYMDLFGTERVKIFLFDDFVRDTPAVYRQLLDFIGVDQNIPGTFKAYNVNKTTRHDFLKRMMLQTPPWLKSAGKLLFPHQSRRRDALMYWLWKVNTRSMIRPPLDPLVRSGIMEVMKPEMVLLKEVAGIDVSRWY